MIIRGQADLIGSLEKQEGFKFKTFELGTEGEFLPTDADWNYKDVPHLKHIHHEVEGFPAYMGHDIVGSFFIQNIFGGLLRVPLSVVNYQSAKNEQTYFTTLFWFVLIIRTSYEQTAPLYTKVRTRYAFGAQGWVKFLLPFAFPLLKRSIEINFKNLMYGDNGQSGDVPMRRRRGELRKMGYTFKGDNKDYSFFNTTKIMEDNVIPPQNSEQNAPIEIELKTILKGLETSNPYYIGKADLQGIQVYKDGDELKFYPRTCPHEGACLDGKKSKLQAQGKDTSTVICEWHGRHFKPLYTHIINYTVDSKFKIMFAIDRAIEINETK